MFQVLSKQYEICIQSAALDTTHCHGKSADQRVVELFVVKMTNQLGQC